MALNLQPSPATDVYQRPLRCLRVSVTDRCNLRCQYCMPAEGVPTLPKAGILDYDELTKLVRSFMGAGVRKVRITGGEPLLRRELWRFVEKIASLESLEDLALTTNGTLLSAQAKILKDAGLHRLTLSLDTLRDDRFQEITRRDRLKDVLQGVEAIQDAGFENTKLDAVIMRGVNEDEIVDLLHFAKQNQMEARFIEYMDVGGAVDWTADAVFSGKEMLKVVAKQFGPFVPVEKDGWAPANRYQLADGTIFGVIASTTTPFCATCDRGRIMADGQWLTCLYATTGLDLRTPLRQGMPQQEITSLIQGVWKTRDDRGAAIRLLTEERGPLVGIGEIQAEPHLAMSTRGG